MKLLVLAGRILFSLIFLNAITFHFTDVAVAYAASRGVPAPSLLVPLAGIIAVIGSLSIILGYKAKFGAWMIVLFLIPVTFYMHSFWEETDQMQYQMQIANFMKNISMLGGALLISYFGAGPLSIDAGTKTSVVEVKHDGSQRKVTAPAEAEEYIKEFCPYSRRAVFMNAGNNLFI